MCMLMTFASIERPSMKQPRGEMQCTHDGGLLALSPSLTDPQDDPIDQVSAFTNLKGDVRRYRIRVVAGRSLGPQT
jgi:hypothetical protein